MNGIVMMVIAIVILGGAYLTYGRWLEKKRGIDPKTKTPAYEMEDGVDYVPGKPGVIFGHQFASIAGTFNGFAEGGALNVANGSTATTSLIFLIYISRTIWLYFVFAYIFVASIHQCGHCCNREII